MGAQGPAAADAAMQQVDPRASLLNVGLPHCSGAVGLQNVTVLDGTEQDGIPQEKTVDGQPLQPAAAAADDGATQPQTTKLLALHRAVWSSGVCCVLSAAFIFAVAALLVKLTGNRVPVLEITLIRSGISLVISVVLIKARDIRPCMGNRHNIKWLIPRGVFGAIAMTTFYAAILLLPLADGMTLFFLNPCLTAIVAWALRGEPLGLLGLSGCLCSLLGVVVLIHPPMLFGGHANWGPQRVWGTAFGLISAVCCAGAFISIRFIGKSEPAIVVALYFHLSTLVISTGPLAFGWPQPLQPLSWLDALLLLGVAAGSFLGQLFMTRSLQLENASLVSSLNFSQVLYSYAFGIIFFSEHLTMFGVLGSLLVALGMVCVTVRPKDTAAADSSSTERIAPSISERARRLDSFKRLLSRSRRGNAADESSLHDEAAEGLPLTSSAALASCDSGMASELQLAGVEASQQQQLPAQSSRQNGQVENTLRFSLEQQQQQEQRQQQQQQHPEVGQVMLPSSSHRPPAELVGIAPGMHHRHAQLPVDQLQPQGGQDGLGAPHHDEAGGVSPLPHEPVTVQGFPVDGWRLEQAHGGQLGHTSRAG